MRRVLWLGLSILAALGCGSSDQCSNSLAGTQPFSRTVRGEVEFAVADNQRGARTERGELDFDVYFPRGFAPNAPVILAAQTYGGFHASSGTLDSDAKGTLAWNGFFYWTEHDVTAAISADGIDVEVHSNFAEPSTDVSVSAEGHGLLCPGGATAAPALVASSRRIGPLSRPSLGLTVPLDEATLAVQASTQSGSVAAAGRIASVRGPDGPEVLAVEPVGVIPPNEDLEVEFAALQDVLGRGLPTRTTFAALRTTAALADLEFDSSPGAAVVATCRPSVADGVMTFRPYDMNGRCSGEQDVLIQLVAPEGSRAVEITFASTLYHEPALPEFALVRSDGSYTKAIRDSGQPSLAMDIPAGSGPIWLAMHLYFDEALPQNLPPLPEELAIGRIAFK